MAPTQPAIKRPWLRTGRGLVVVECGQPEVREHGEEESHSDCPPTLARSCVPTDESNDQTENRGGQRQYRQNNDQRTADYHATSEPGPKPKAYGRFWVGASHGLHWCLLSRFMYMLEPVSYTHLRAHETRHDLVCRLL